MTHNQDRQQGFKGVPTRPYVDPVMQRQQRKKWMWAAIILILLGAAAYAVWSKTTNDSALNDTEMPVDTVELTTDATSTTVTTTTAPLSGEKVIAEAVAALSGQGVTAVTGASYAYDTVSTAILADPDLFDYANNTIRSCDSVLMVKHRIPKTPYQLTAALTLLFTDSFDYGFPPANFVRTQKDLRFSHATVTNGVASVYLLGQVGPIADDCDETRIQTQVTETALQFSNVHTVAIFLNGEPFRVD